MANQLRVIHGLDGGDHIFPPVPHPRDGFLIEAEFDVDEGVLIVKSHAGNRAYNREVWASAIFEPYPDGEDGST